MSNRSLYYIFILYTVVNEHVATQTSELARYVATQTSELAR